MQIVTYHYIITSEETKFLEFSVSVDSAVELGLGYKYCSVWDMVMNVMETFYLTAGKHCHKFMTKVRCSYYCSGRFVLRSPIIVPFFFTTGFHTNAHFLFVCCL